ncbi:hypothetical protein BC830DRAFT_1117694 [Chytriomyces sp. MP71]|nr:hypothetical protein BC830DRAFT_1117694 [Chytriomyces sp. MP71]
MAWRHLPLFPIQNSCRLPPNMSDLWKRMFEDGKPSSFRNSTASARSGLAKESSRNSRADAIPLVRDRAIVTRIKQTPFCRLLPKSFFIGPGGILAVAFDGFPDPLLVLKEQIDKISGSTLVDERPESVWPQTTFAALKNEDATLSLEQLEKLVDICRSLTTRLHKIRDKVVISEVSYVIFSSRSLESLVFCADFPLHEVDKPVDFVSDAQKVLVNGAVTESLENPAKNLKEINKPGHRIQHFRNYASETEVVIFLTEQQELIEVILEFSKTVEKLFPGIYEFLSPDTLHCILRPIR